MATFPAGLRIFLGVLFLVCLLALGSAARFTARQYRENRPRVWVLISFALVILTIIALTGAGYYQGKFPFIQGRFLLPVLFTITLVICLGLYNFPLLRVIFWPMCAALLVLDAALLFGNLLPYHYYFSEFYQNGQPLPYIWHGWIWAFNTFLANYLSGKPAWVVAGALICLSGYVMLLAALLARQGITHRSGFLHLKKQEVDG